MKYLEAVEIVKTKQYLIGQKVGGATIDEIIICPKKSDYFQVFEERYWSTLSADFAIIPFTNEEVEVAVIIGKKQIIANNLSIEWKTVDWAEANLDRQRLRTGNR